MALGRLRARCRAMGDVDGAAAITWAIRCIEAPVVAEDEAAALAEDEVALERLIEKRRSVS